MDFAANVETEGVAGFCAQFLVDANGNGNYGFIVAIPANVINIFGGVLSANQVPAWICTTSFSTAAWLHVTKAPSLWM